MARGGSIEQRRQQRIDAGDQAAADAVAAEEASDRSSGGDSDAGSDASEASSSDVEPEIGAPISEEMMREQLRELAFSASAAMLVLQLYNIKSAHLDVAEKGFDALCDRLTESAADAMTDRVARISQRDSADSAAAAALAMLLEVQCAHMSAIASGEASADEERARALLQELRVDS